jgi:hypothetical protein
MADEFIKKYYYAKNMCNDGDEDLETGFEMFMTYIKKETDAMPLFDWTDILSRVSIDKSGKL